MSRTQQCMKTAWGLHRGRNVSEWSSLSIKRTLMGSQQSVSDETWHSVQCFSCLTFSERETRLQLIVGSLYTLTHTQSIACLFLWKRLTTPLTFSHSLLQCVVHIQKNPQIPKEKPWSKNSFKYQRGVIQDSNNRNGLIAQFLWGKKDSRSNSNETLFTTEILHYIRIPIVAHAHHQNMPSNKEDLITKVSFAYSCC